ncbi:MAG: pitrilysin family protein [Geminicoccaceae bacterium]
MQDQAVAPGKTNHVQEIVSSKGIRAYLITERSIPFLSLAAYCSSGAITDPVGKEGLAYMAGGIIDEGAGPYDSQAFRGQLEDNAIRLSFDLDRDACTCDLKTLTSTRELAFELLRLALKEPRFDSEPVERVRSQILADLRRRETDPEYLASRSWFAKAFPHHPYGRATRGTPASIGTITVEDMRAFIDTRIARDRLVVGVSGDIEADELAQLLDHAFGDLPATAPALDVTRAAPVVGGTEVVRLPIPQSVVTFGHAGIDRTDADYYAAYVANYILGGGGFSSRLTEEVREKRGLAYSVYSYLYDLDLSPLWLGGVATNNAQVAQSLSLVREELKKLAAGDIAQHELDDARTYLTGSFPLRLTSNDQTAKLLGMMLFQDLGRDYLERRNGLIEAVTLDDVRRVSARLFSGEMLVSVVGDPQGI